MLEKNRGRGLYCSTYGTQKLIKLRKEVLFYVWILYTKCTSVYCDGIVWHFVDYWKFRNQFCKMAERYSPKISQGLPSSCFWDIVLNLENIRLKKPCSILSGCCYWMRHDLRTFRCLANFQYLHLPCYCSMAHSSGAGKSVCKNLYKVCSWILRQEAQYYICASPLNQSLSLE